MADSEAFHSLGEEEEEATEVETDEMDTGKGVKHPCIRCKKKVGRNSVQCRSCKLWTHVACQNISKELMTILSNPGRFGGSITWSCDSCTASAARLELKMTALENRFQEVENRMTRTEGTVQGNSKRMEEMEQRQTRMEEYMRREKDRQRTERNEELRERESRRKNVIIYRMEEAGDWATTVAERKDWDVQTCDNIFKALKLTMDAHQVIKFCRRVGEKGEEPRPLVVGFNREAQKEELMERARDLRSTNFAEIGVAHDLTQEQRKDEAEMSKEVDRKNEERTADDKAKNLEWMVVGKKGEKRMIKGVPRRGQGAGPQMGAGLQRGRGREGPTRLQTGQALLAPTQDRGGAGFAPRGSRGSSKRNREGDRDSGDERAPPRQPSPSQFST